MQEVVHHLERFAGPIVGAWTKDIEGRELPFKVVQLERGPTDQSITFSTVGLSNHVLLSRVSEKTIRHELVFVVRKEASYLGVPGILQQVGGQALSTGSAYLRGDVVGPFGALFPGSQMEALYVAMPAYFPDGFSSCVCETNRHVVFAWLVPISSSESTYIQGRGWSAFEDRLVEQNPDVTDVFRNGMALP